MIDSCAFGSMTIDGQTFSSDLKIFMDGRVEDNWWRTFGHTLNPGDISDLVELRPEVIVIGTGIYGRMVTAPVTEALLKASGITLIAEPTETAAAKFNEALNGNIKVAAGFHLTC